jgi:hypothetical protein
LELTQQAVEEGCLVVEMENQLPVGLEHSQLELLFLEVEQDQLLHRKAQAVHSGEQARTSQLDHYLEEVLRAPSKQISQHLEALCLNRLEAHFLGHNHQNL